MRPELETSWRVFAELPGDGCPALLAARLGGEAGQAVAAGRIANLAPMKLSHVFNRTGLPVPHIRRKTLTGGDGSALIVHMRDLLDYLHEFWGEADLEIPHATADDFTGSVGLLLFELPFAQGSGHATLWNGRACADHGAFERARWVRLWEMDAPDGG